MIFKDIVKRIHLLDVNQIKAYDRNARHHSPEQINMIKASIEQFGFVNPILIDDQSEIIAGHGRLMAAKALGMVQVPVIRIEDLTPDQVKAYRLVDNRIAEQATWNFDLLKTELDGLEIDVEMLGFDRLFMHTFINESSTVDNVIDIDEDFSDKKPKYQIMIEFDDSEDSRIDEIIEAIQLQVSDDQDVLFCLKDSKAVFQFKE